MASSSPRRDMVQSADRRPGDRKEPRVLRVEIAVIGAGPAGLTAAIALASAGIETALVSKRPVRPHNRTTALLARSVPALAAPGVCEASREPVHRPHAT